MEVSLSFARFSSMEPGVRHNNIYWRQLNLWPLALFEISRQSQHSWQGKSYSPLPHVILRQTAERGEKVEKKKQQGETHERHETVSRSNKWHGIWLVEPHGSYANMQDRMGEQIIQEFNFLKMFCQCPEQLHPSRTSLQSSIYRSHSELVDRDTKMDHRSVLMGHRQRGKRRDVLLLKSTQSKRKNNTDCI